MVGHSRTRTSSSGAHFAEATESAGWVKPMRHLWAPNGLKTDLGGVYLAIPEGVARAFSDLYLEVCQARAVRSQRAFARPPRLVALRLPASASHRTSTKAISLGIG
jgi:hypothetical protein